MADHYTNYLNKRLSEVAKSGRWTPGMKALVCEAIRRGVLSHARACAKYDLSLEELNSWLERDRAFGTRGHSVTKLQVVGRHG